MNLKHLFTGLFWVLAVVVLPGQTASEALRLSLSYPLGTARNLGTGNSMLAIGPDFSAIGSNPAGIAAYWKSEFLITGGLSQVSSTSGLAADRNTETRDRYALGSLPNIGFVVVNRPWNQKPWMTSNWAVGLNRVADYRRELSYVGRTLGSVTDSWRENATGLISDDLNGFEEGLAWESGAIYDFDEDNIYETDYQLNPAYPLYKQEFTTIEGGKSELFLGYGANLDNKVLFGASVNLPLVNFTESRQYIEADGADNGVPFFNTLAYTRYINTTGFGLNGKFGVTVKPVRYAHIALAVHTPTLLLLTDNFNTTLEYDFSIPGGHDGPVMALSPYGTFRYALRTPWKIMGGGGLIIEKTGFLSASISWTDYSTMRFKYNVRGNGNFYEQQERSVNHTISREYGPAIALNIGGEVALKRWRLRAGAGLEQSPFVHDNSFDPSYHCGIGYRGDAFYVDLGYGLSREEEGFVPYTTIDAPQPLVVSERTRHVLALTTGLKF